MRSAVHHVNRLALAGRAGVAPLKCFVGELQAHGHFVKRFGRQRSFHGASRDRRQKKITRIAWRNCDSRLSESTGQDTFVYIGAEVASGTPSRVDRRTIFCGVEPRGPRHGPPKKTLAMFERILIVDDEATARMALATLLRREGFEVRDASDGATALAECHSFRPDLILLDIVMPGVDGFEVCRRIKATPETRLTPVVLITGLTATQDRIQGINAGADDFLSKPIDFNELLARSRSLLRLKQYTDELEHAEAVLFSLAHSIEARDPYTHGHCERLAEMSARMGERLGVPEEQIKALRRAGVVHDIGKVAVADSILLKPGPLTADEAKIMQKHPVVGERICAPLKTFRLVLPIIRHHHEKHDGTGYPDALSGEEIPLTARILQLSDVYDALTTDRPYKVAFTPEVALDLMGEEAERGWWDRELFEAFREMIRLHHKDLAPEVVRKVVN